MVSYLYELPVGKGKQFLANSPRPVSAVISNWRVSGVQRYLGGQPISFFGARGIPGFDNGIRPNRVTTQPVRRSGPFNPFTFNNNLISPYDPASAGACTTGYWNCAAFADPNPSPGPNVPYVFGNMPRNSANIRGFAFYDEDFGINKNIPITERIKMDFRGELFNAFNRHTFNKPDSGVQDDNFGQITQYATRTQKCPVHDENHLLADYLRSCVNGPEDTHGATHKSGCRAMHLHRERLTCFEMQVPSHQRESPRAFYLLTTRRICLDSYAAALLPGTSSAFTEWRLSYHSRSLDCSRGKHILRLRHHIECEGGPVPDSLLSRFAGVEAVRARLRLDSRMDSRGEPHNQESVGARRLLFSGKIPPVLCLLGVWRKYFRHRPGNQ